MRVKAKLNGVMLGGEKRPLGWVGDIPDTEAAAILKLGEPERIEVFNVEDIGADFLAGREVDHSPAARLSEDNRSGDGGAKRGRGRPRGKQSDRQNSGETGRDVG